MCFQKGHLLLQGFGSLFHGLGSQGSFFHERRILLRALIHFQDRFVHLINATGLLLRGRTDLRNDIRHALHRIHDFGQGLPRLIHQVTAIPNLLDRLIVQGFDLLGCPGLMIKGYSFRNRPARVSLTCPLSTLTLNLPPFFYLGGQ